ncbi:MAG: UvrD-helicase domain-containing protein [Roseburia sp.]|nr:UvrD-helicase domain-containing protein [Anaeroplasma bactoclasticum]MCM1196046.1 UvrD-helicase domain-containing protein [Roseburia sp.]
MGIFSKLFKKKVNSQIEYNKECKDHNDICDFLVLYSNMGTFLNQDEYISTKALNQFKETYSDKLDYIKKLDASNLLESMCQKTNYIDVLSYINELDSIEELVKKHNSTYIATKKIQYKDYLDHILNECDPNILLDDDQRTAILSDEDYSLVIAGAGAGKTTTVAAKIKYLVDIKKVNAKDILVVSFTNKAVGELRERVNQQLHIDCPITTFHSTGIAIIKKDSPEEKITPVSEGFLYTAIRDYLQGAILDNQSLLDKMILLFASYFEAPFEEGDLKGFFTYVTQSDFSTLKSNVGDYNQQIIDARSQRYFTIRDERVNSKQEVQIANFLYMNNIDYVYEPTYPFYVEGSDKYYTPDFLITQGDRTYYIEHFALSQDGTNSRFSKLDIEKYKKAINDKIKLHKKCKTNLIYTWSKYNDGISLLSHLEKELVNAGFNLKKKTSEEVFSKIKATEENKYIGPMIKLIQTFISNYKVNGYSEKHFAIMKDNTKNIRTKLFLEITEGAYLFYEQRLKDAHKVDFSDMINESARLLNKNAEMKEKLGFKYIIVDEYQDISKQRFDLTEALSKVCDAKIIAVGDDWQSIYAFSGSDITLFTQFQQKMGYAKELKIVKTYRNPQEVIDIAGKFVQENETQIKKELISSKHIDKPVVILTYSDEYQVLKEQGFKNDGEAKAKMIEDAITRVIEYNARDKKAKDSSILLIGRYNFDGFKLGNTPYFVFNENTGEIKSKKYPNIKLSFMTAHSSKGLGFDNVIIINAIDTMYGFPAQLQMDPVLQLVIHDDKTIEYAEERRLFYVAMTRTKNRVFIVAPETRPSKFVLELQEKYKNVSIEGNLNPKSKFLIQKMCPICGYPLQLRFNKNYGLKLYMCTNEPEICEYMTNDIHGGKVSICKCDKCKDGFLIVKQSKTNNYFLGCTNYKTINCTRQMSFQEYFQSHNLPIESAAINYNAKVEGDKFEEFQNININIYEAKPKFEKKPFDVTLYQKLYDELLNYRNSKASSINSRFYIFPEQTIYDICLSIPLTLDDLSKIRGIGDIKLEKYGNDIISIINKHLGLQPTNKVVIQRKKDQNESIGKKWNAEEEKQLLEEYSQGMKFSEIAKLHSRNSGGIRARLKKLGVIE